MDNVLLDPLDTPETTNKPSLAESLTKVLIERNNALAAAQRAERADATSTYGRAIVLELGLAAEPVTVAELENSMRVLGLQHGRFELDVADAKQFVTWSAPDFDYELQSRIANQTAERLSNEVDSATAALRKAEADLEEVRGRSYRETSAQREWVGSIAQVEHKRRNLGSRLRMLGVDLGVLGAAADKEGA